MKVDDVAQRQDPVHHRRLARHRPRNRTTRRPRRRQRRHRRKDRRAASEDLPGTIYTAAEEIERAGGKALPLVVDVRDEPTVKEAIDKAAAQFGGIDIVRQQRLRHHR